MIFLSAQPDDFFFTWQIELQLFNFIQNGITNADDIHILVGYNPERGLSSFFKEVKKKNRNNARFFTYPDNRKSKAYVSSIRPHIINQHFESFPGLSNENIFYHDSDILFTELPDFLKLENSESWIVSDTKSYIGIDYIISRTSVQFLEEMCKIIGIEKQQIEANNDNAGGAQYFIKNCPKGFWSKVENNSEELFKLLNRYNQLNKCSDKTIEAWYSDMWSLLWNAWLFKKDVRISEELNFCWTKDSVDELRKNKIFHYAGTVDIEDVNYFRKFNYRSFPPYYDLQVLNISDNNCSSKIKKTISEFSGMQEKHILQNTTFIFILQNLEDLEDLINSINFIHKNFKTEIVLIYSGSEEQIDSKYFPLHTKYHRITSEKAGPIFSKKNLEHVSTEFFCFYNHKYIVSSSDLMKGLNYIFGHKDRCVIPCLKTYHKVDLLLKNLYFKFLNIEVLRKNKGKCIKRKLRSNPFVISRTDNFRKFEEFRNIKSMKQTVFGFD